MDGSATVILKEKVAFKSLDVVDATFVDKAVEKSPVVVQMLVRTIQRVLRVYIRIHSKKRGGCCPRA